MDAQHENDKVHVAIAIAHELRELLAGVALFLVIGLAVVKWIPADSAPAAYQPQFRASDRVDAPDVLAAVSPSDSQSQETRSPQTQMGRASNGVDDPRPDIAVNVHGDLNVQYYEFHSTRVEQRISGVTPRKANDPARALTIFGDGLHKFWSHRYAEAIERFQMAREADETNAACLYFLALAHVRSGRVDLAERLLAEAVQLESQYPVNNWGRLMERVQGRQRLWIEDARLRG